MASLAELGEVAKGAWGKNYKEHDYGQDDMRNYHQGRYVAGAGAAAGAGGIGYGVHHANRAMQEAPAEFSAWKNAPGVDKPAALERLKAVAPRRAKGIGRGGKVALAAPLIGAGVGGAVGIGNAARKRVNRFRNQKSNF